MRKLALVSLAAAAIAALPATAWAQPRAGHQGGGQQFGGRMGMQHGVRMGGQMHQRGMQHHRFGNVQRFRRGHVIPNVWMGPRFQVHAWQMYGFPQPQPGFQWVRYYDDALLVDRGGRVMDGRYGFDWDRYGDRWVYGDGGAAPYYADDDYDEDERYDERYDRRYDERRDERYEDRRDGRRGGGWDYSEYGRCDCSPGRMPPPPPGYGHGGYGGYGYGYGYGYGTRTIVETTVETGGSQVIEEVIEERVVHQPRRRVYRRPAPPPRRPVRGERG
jgi:Ni/Co efflux regulator RcnB